LAFIALALAGTLWADGPWRDRFLGVSPLLKFLVLPFLVYHFSRSRRSHWVLWAFVSSCALLLLASSIVVLEPQWNISHQGVAGVPVKNSIDQSYEFVLCIFVLAGMLLELFNERRLAAFAVCALLILAFFADLMFVVTSRTAVVYIPILILLFATRHLDFKSMALFISAVAVAAMVTWFSSAYLRDRVERVAIEYKLYHEKNQPTSTGQRLAYWQESLGWISQAPLIGHGTGSTKQLFEAAAAGKDGAWADMIRNPHNQTLYVAIQWGLLGCIALYALWYSHIRLFLASSPAAWVGLVIVVQNVLSSLFNSHLFDFTEGWIYVLGVGTAAGVRVQERQEGQGHQEN
jgi:O-antigen ligase